jgi:two-component system NtrC family sensor kinase
MLSKRDTLPEGMLPEPVEAAHQGAKLEAARQGSPSAARDSSDRLTISTLPKSEALSGERAVLPLGDPWRYPAPGELPGRVSERLLALWAELPLADGDNAVICAVVEAIAALLPEWHVGACLVPAAGGSQSNVFAERSALQGAAGAGVDPTRLFPFASHEHVVSIEPGGSTLHVAGDDPSGDADAPAFALLLERTVAVARRGIELSRMQARAADALAEARSLNSRAAQAEKLASLGQIAAGVVHELNNPLTSIVAYTDYLIRKAGTRPAGPDADEIDRLGRISESAGRMLRFTRDLVSYARPSSETPAPVSIHNVVDQAVAFCEHVLAGANATVHRRFAADLPHVLGKPEQLAQVFVNLLTNACHAMMPAGGTVTIATRREPGVVIVELADTGHGIAAEHVAHIFTPFFTTKTSGTGTGLGLAIVKSILDGHGGTIRVASSSAGGGGATFAITLPLWER